MITNQDCLTFAEGAMQIRQRIPARLALRIRDMKRRIAAKAEDINEELTELAEEYAKRNEDGEIIYTDEAKTKIKLDPQRSNEFVERRRDLLTMEVLAEDWPDCPTPIRGTDLKDKDGNELDIDWNALDAMGGFVVNDFDGAQEKEAAKAKREQKRKKRAAVNGATPEAAEAVAE